MIEHLGINTPYFGILVSLIPFVIATYFYKKTNGFFLLAPLFRKYGCRYCFFEIDRN